MGHIELSRDADAIVVAPASADFIAKLAHGHADDLLSTLCLARDCPLLVAPAMNRQMWAQRGHAAQRRAARAPTASTILGPGSGDQACGEIGDGRMLEPEEILAALLASAQPKLLAGKRVLLTAGPDVRSDRSGARHHQSQLGQDGLRAGAGRAEAGAERDAGRRTDVAAARRPASTRIDVQSAAADGGRGRRRRSTARDIFIAVAAVADYTPARSPRRSKIKKSGDAADADARSRPSTFSPPSRRARNAPFCVGFAAESRRRRAERRGQAPPQESAAARRQPRAGRARQRRERGHAARRRAARIRCRGWTSWRWRAGWSRRSRRGCRGR